MINIAIVRASPIVLLVTIRHHNLSLDVVSAHCPHAGVPADQHDAFWDKFRAALKARQYRQVSLVIGIDLNGRLGGTTSVHVGGLAPSDECRSGSVFHEVLKENGLFVPSTFEHFHKGGAHATLEKNGTVHREISLQFQPHGNRLC